MTASPRVKTAAVFAAALALFLGAAAWRWPDSAHAIGVVRAPAADGRRGGEARHPVALRAGPSRYQVVVTAPVLPPWRGDARIELEGEPALDWSVELSQPVLDLGLRRWPRLDGRVLRGLAPGDKLALWVDLAAPAGGGGSYRLVLRDEVTSLALLTVPIQLGGEGGGHAHH